MNPRIVNVEIIWLTRESGGKDFLPSGPKYSTVAKFEKLKELWPEEAWSIVLHFSASDFTGNKLNAKMNLLFEENAPQNLLYIGESFDLYEGRKLVASGKIVQNPISYRSGSEPR